jgi:hypothetical protein
MISLESLMIAILAGLLGGAVSIVINIIFDKFHR